MKLFYNSFFGGILAGSLGLGGGLIINPILLNEGLIPEMAAAASMMVVFFASLSTST